MVGKIFFMGPDILSGWNTPFSFIERLEGDGESDLPDLVISVFLMAYEFSPDGKTKP